MRFYLTFLLTAIIVCNAFAASQTTVHTVTPFVEKSSLLSPRKQSREKRVANLAISPVRQLVTPAASVVKKSPAMQLTTPTTLAKAAKEEIVLNFEKFSYFEYYQSSGDWFISMSCDDPAKPEYGYVVKFDYFAPKD